MDALWFGCIPVLIADHYIPPLTDLLDWENFSVVVPESQVSHRVVSYRHLSMYHGKELGM